jgi:hypothetical protein
MPLTGFIHSSSSERILCGCFGSSRKKCYGEREISEDLNG